MCCYVQEVCFQVQEVRCSVQGERCQVQQCAAYYKTYVAKYKICAAMYKKYAAKYTAATFVLFISSKECHWKKYDHNSRNVQLFLTLASQAFKKAAKERL